MFASCACPGLTELNDINVLACGENLGQIQKIIFQRRTATPFASLTAPQTLANWTALQNPDPGDEKEKITVTPFFENLIIPPVEAITEGGDDNTTLDGNIIIVGASTIGVTGNFRSLPAATLVQLKAYNCEADLTAYFINEYGKIIGYSANGTTFAGFEISEWFIGDGGSEGKNTQDKTMFRFNMRYGWRDKLKIITPSDFNARFALNL